VISNCFNVDIFDSFIESCVRRWEVRIVRKPLAELAAEQKFLGGYCDFFALDPDRRILFRENISPFGFRRVRADGNRRSRAGSMVVDFLRAGKLGFEGGILAAHANAPFRAHGTNELRRLVGFETRPLRNMYQRILNLATIYSHIPRIHSGFPTRLIQGYKVSRLNGFEDFVPLGTGQASPMCG
jgi:hypothetical protein